MQAFGLSLQMGYMERTTLLRPKSLSCLGFRPPQPRVKQ